MHFYALIPFALLLWWPDSRPFPSLLVFPSTGSTLAVVLGQICLIGLAGGWVSFRVRRLLAREGAGIAPAQFAHHFGALGLRFAAVATFLVDMFLTAWPDWVRQAVGLPDGWAIDELVILAPFFLSLVIGWLTLYPADARLRRFLQGQRMWEGEGATPNWTLPSYLVFQIRHQLLVVAAPMLFIMLVNDWTRPIAAWMAYCAMSGAGALIFILAPLMLRVVWSTHPLPVGPLRSRLEALSRRIGLRFQEILVWRSERMMVNAAVMGLFPQVRYVLLSDGLLESMSDDQIEAVFSHEAGHIRHRHLTFFVIFAILGTLIVSGVMELLLRMAESDRIDLSLDEISIAGFGAMLLVWGLGLGWVSRRFEAQADLYGAQCVSPPDEAACGQPCSVHGAGSAVAVEQAATQPTARLCATGAGIFRSALERVANLNGIPLRERSWRHSSIAYRLNALSRLAGDPKQAAVFDRLLRRLKAMLLTMCVSGLLICGVYLVVHPGYRAEIEKPLQWFKTNFTGSPAGDSSSATAGHVPAIGR